MSSVAPERGSEALRTSPFVGLAFFDESSAEFFFGREAERNAIIDHLSASRLTLLYAESGVGKSSLLRAGVAVRLSDFARESQADGETPAFVPVVFSTWRDDPIAGLVAAIAEAIAPFAADGAAQSLPRDDLAKAVELATEATSSTLLVILDQFEESFLYQPRAAPNAFADQLATCINRADLHANFLISIREDAYSGIGDFFKGRVANVYGNYLHLEYLDDRAARAAITKPVRRFNELQEGGEHWTVDDRLVDAVVANVQHDSADGGTAGAEPAYLQLIMQRLWNAEQEAASHTLRLETLERLGGAGEIISRHVTSAIETLPAKQQDAAARLFRYLVGSRGKEAAASAADLADRSEIPEAELQPILRELSAGDVKILRPVASPELGGPLLYEIFHDSLAEPIRRWRYDHEQTAKESERRKKRFAFGLAVLGALLFVAASAGIYISVQDGKTHEKRIRQSVASAGRIAGLSGSPTFGPSVAAVTALAADRRLSATFDARSTLLAMLQTNVGMPKLAVGHSRAGEIVAFFPHSSLLASGSDDGTVRIWDSLGHAVSRALRTPTTSDQVLNLAIRPDGKFLVASRQSGEIDLWNVENPKNPTLVTPPILAKGGAAENVVAFSRDGKILAAGANDGTIRLWDVTDPPTPKAYDSITAPKPVYGLAFRQDADGSLGVANGTDLRQYNGLTRAALANGTKPTFTVGYKGATESVAYGKGGAIAAAVADFSTPGIVLYTPAERSRFLYTTDEMQSVAFTPDGRTLVAGGNDWNVTTWDVKTARRFGPPRMQSNPFSNVTSVAVSPDGRTIAATGVDTVVRLWPLKPAAPLATVIGSRSTIDRDRQAPAMWTLALGPGKLVASADGTDGTEIWSLDAPRTGPPQSLQAIPANLAGQKNQGSYAVAWEKRRNLLATSHGPRIVLYDTRTACGSPRRFCKLGASPTTGTSGHPVHSGSILTFAFDASGKLLASGGNDGRVILWDVSNPKAPAALWSEQEVGSIAEVAFDPKRQILAEGGNDGKLRLWDVRDRHHPKLLGKPQVGHGGFEVASIAFSADGDTFVSGGQDQQVVFWTVDPQTGLKPSGQTLFQTDTILSLAFSPDGKTLAAGDSQSTCLYDVATRQGIGGGNCLLGNGESNITYLSTISDLVFARGGKVLLSSGEGNPLVAWDSLLWERANDDATFERLTTAACALVTPGTPTTAQWNAAFDGTHLEDRPTQICKS